jgi:hypothetical protein
MADQDPEQRRAAKLAATARWKAANPERVRAATARWRAAHSERVRQYTARWRAAHQGQWGAIRRRHARALRAQVVAGYGGRCTCCGVTARHHVDHVYGDGAAERRRGNRWLSLYRKILREGFPPSYQLLCGRCNTQRARRGWCCGPDRRQLTPADRPASSKHPAEPAEPAGTSPTRMEDGAGLTARRD